MRKFLLAGLILIPVVLFAQTSPNWPVGYNPSMAEWNALWASKLDVTSATIVGPTITNPTITGGTDTGTAIATATITGSSYAGSVAATTLSASNVVTLSPANQPVTISPTGTGQVIMNPATAGTLDNVSLGVTTPLAVKSTTLNATGAVTLSPASANVTISPTGTGSVSISPASTLTLSPTGAMTVSPTAASTINNVAIGATTPLNGTFLTLKGALRGFIAGCEMSAAGGGVTLTLGTCSSSDSTNTIYMDVASSYTKTTASWTLGSAGGMLDTGATGGAASTWYHVYEIIRPDTGVTDYTMSLNATTPGLPANYTKFRRIGAIFLDGSKNIRGFTQKNDEFLWIAQIADISTAALSTTATLFTMSTPLGVQTNALIRGTMQNGSPGAALLINSPDETSIAGGAITTDNRTGGNPVAAVNTAFYSNTRTNTSSQVRAVASAASTTVGAGAYGYIDTRGRNN